MGAKLQWQVLNACDCATGQVAAARPGTGPVHGVGIVQAVLHEVARKYRMFKLSQDASDTLSDTTPRA